MTLQPQSLTMQLRQHWQTALYRRLRFSQRITFGHKQLFIMPSKLGCYLLALSLLLWLLGTNYQNNLLLASAFFLWVLELYAIFATFRQLSGMSVTLTESLNIQANGPWRLVLDVNLASSTDNTMLTLMATDKNGSFPLDLLPQHYVIKGQGRLHIAMPGLRRGRHLLPRLRVESRFPLGLAVCWSYLIVDQDIWAWPEPLPAPSATSRSQDDDYQGLQPYRPGMNLAQVSWRHSPDGPQWAKQWQGAITHNVSADYYLLSGDHELRLRHLANLVTQPTFTGKLHLPSGHYAQLTASQALLALAKEP